MWEERDEMAHLDYHLTFYYNYTLFRLWVKFLNKHSLYFYIF